MKDLVQNNQEQRKSALHAVYRLAEGKTNRVVELSDVERTLGALNIGPRECRDAIRYLVQSQFLKYHGPTRCVITADGINEAEASAGQPDRDAQYDEAAAAVFNTVQHFHASVGVVQTGSHNTANVVQQVSEAGELLRYLAELREATCNLPADKKEAAIELVDTLEEQAKSEKPRKALVKQCAEGLKEYLVPCVPLIQMIVELFLRKG